MRRHVLTLPIQFRPGADLITPVDPTGTVRGLLKIDTDGVVLVSEGVSDRDAILGVMWVTPGATFHELDALPRRGSHY